MPMESVSESKGLPFMTLQPFDSSSSIGPMSPPPESKAPANHSEAVSGRARAACVSLRNAATRRAYHVAATWGFFEATLFFVIPDVWLGWVALHDGRRAVRASFVATAAALAGGIVVFLAPAFFLGIFPHLPAIPDPMIEQVAAQVAGEGWLPLVKGPVSGIPYKLYAATLGTAGADIWAFALITIVARLERFLPVVLIIWLMVRFARPMMADRPCWTAGCYFGFWILQYVVYFALIASKYGGL